MFGTHDLALFVASGLLLNIAPGVDFLYVLSRAASRGTLAGVWAALGIGLGCFVHISFAALGLSAILASSALAFTAVKWVGAAYLIYIGISMLRQRGGLTLTLASSPAAGSGTGQPPAERAADGHARIFWQGFLTNVLNPKVALFFLAFVPQFIEVSSPTKVQAFLLLGTIFNTTGTAWNLFVAWAAGYLARRLQVASRLGTWLNRSLGAMFIALGIRLGLASRA
ncbi:MAG TPA: LysE family translocator [Steroidobacteraceae bacterium]|nr:LysE family translocator [Steroidobacteraceae bacterium]